MGQIRALVVSMIVIANCKPSYQDISFLITRTKINDRVKQHTVTIQGNGIDTEIQIEPKDDLASVLIIGNGFILGDPRKDSVTAYTDTANTLVAISDKRECVRRTRQDGGKERHQGLPDTECQELIQTIVKAWDEFKESGAMNKYNTREVVYVIKTKTKEARLECLGSIRISGLGVDDNLDMSCPTVDSAKVVFIPGGVIVRGLNIVYTNTYGQLATVKGISCDQKVFGKYEKVTSDIFESRMSFENKEVSTVDCTKLRNIVTYYLDHPPADIKIKRLDHYIEKDVKYQKFSIEGNGIQDKVNIPETAAQNMQLLNIPGGFILGDWEGNLAFVYSDSLNTLVQITPNLSVELTYEAGKLIKTIPIERSRHLKKMVDVWEEMGKNQAGNGFTVHRYSEELNGHCDQDIMIEGRGVKNRLTVPCVSGNEMETIFTDRGVMVGDYRRNLNSLFSETGEEIVIIDKKNCNWHDYTKENLSIEDLSDWECQRVKRKMDAAVERRKQGYLVALEKRNKEFRVIRNSHLNEKQICKQDIHLSGNGIVEVVKASCVIADSLDLLFMHEGFLLGDFRHDKTSVLSASPGKLVVITNKGRVCDGMLYNQMGGVFEVPINNEDCTKTKRFAEVILKDKESNRSWKITAPGKSTNKDNHKIIIDIVKINHNKEKKNLVQIRGNGINENIKFEMQDDTTTFFNRGRFILGNYKTNSKYIYNSEPNTLFVVEKREKVWQCRKWTYAGGKKSDFPMTDDECNNIESTVQSLWNGMSYNGNSYNVAAYTIGINIIKRMTSTDNECEGSLTVQGDGMDQKESVDCPSLKSTDILFTRHGVVVGDPSRTSVAFFSDGARSLVLFKNGGCSKRRYIRWNHIPPMTYKTMSLTVGFSNLRRNYNNDFKFELNNMSETACTEVRNIIRGYWKASTTEG